MMYGGIYLDTDVEVLGRFDSLLDLVSFIGCEDDRRKRPNAAVIGCVPNASFSSRMTEFYELLDQNNSIIVCDAISRVIKDGHVHDLTILPQRFFYPYNPYSSCAYQKDLPLMASEITSETVAIHHWQKSWKT
jgi:mannosyltransferase OCH1-like enzyme